MHQPTLAPLHLGDAYERGEQRQESIRTVRRAYTSYVDFDSRTAPKCFMIALSDVVIQDSQVIIPNSDSQLKGKANRRGS